MTPGSKDGRNFREDEDGANSSWWSEADVRQSRIKDNDWQGILVHDGSLKCQSSDLRRNGRGSLTLTAFKDSVYKSLERTGEWLDAEYYSALDCTGTVIHTPFPPHAWSSDTDTLGGAVG